MQIKIRKKYYSELKREKNSNIKMNGNNNKIIYYAMRMEATNRNCNSDKRLHLECEKNNA